MLDTKSLQRIANDLIPSFDGVFPINNLPITPKKSYILIANTDPDNLAGKHWIAVIIRNGEGYVFDPLGNAPPLKLQHWMNLRAISWSCNTRQVQSNDSTLCGYFCIYFLWFATCNALRNEHYNNIMNILFPNTSIYINYYDCIVRDFVKVLKI